MNRYLAVLLVIIFLFTIPACAGTAPVSTETKSSGSTDDDLPVVHLTTFTAFETIQGEGKRAVESVIDKYLEENGYAFRIQLDILNLADYLMTCNMNLASGTDLDVFLSLQLSNHVATNALLPLDDYFSEEMQEAASLFDSDWLDCSLFQGKHYAIPAHTTSATTIYYVCRADLIAEMGYDIEKVTDIYTLEELFFQVKQHYPEMWCTDSTSVTTADILNVSGNTLWGFVSSECGIGMRQETAGSMENYFASDTFQEACEMARRWYEKGYLNPAGSTDTTYCPDYIASGEAFGWLVGNCNTAQTQAEGYSAICGRPLVAIPIAESADSNAGFSWAIAKNSEHPREAAQLLNLLYTDSFVLNTICYGIEGVDYMWNDDCTLAAFPEGKDRISVPYSYYVGITVLGDRLKAYPFAVYNTYADLDYIRKKITYSLRSPVYGMFFDTKAISGKITSVSNVVEQYRHALLSGELDNSRFLPQFLDDLETSGIGEIIAEAQAQYNTWTSQKGQS